MILTIGISILFLSIGIFVAYIAYIINKEQKDILPFLTVLAKFGILAYIVVSVIVTIYTLFTLSSEILIIGIILKQIILTIYYIYIYIWSSKLLLNLSMNHVFIMDNSNYIKQIALLFIYLALTEIMVGLIFGLIAFSSSGTFTISTDNRIFAYLIIAIVLEVISLLLKKATMIYEENQLTI